MDNLFARHSKNAGVRVLLVLKLKYLILELHIKSKLNRIGAREGL